MLGDLFIDAIIRIPHKIPPSSLSIFSGAERASEQGKKEGESERLSHQLIKSLTADSSWGLAAAAAAGKQTSHGARKTAVEGEKHDAKSAVFVLPR